MDKLKDKIIIQKTLFGLKGKNIFHFKENGIDYKLNDTQKKMNYFIEYSDIRDPDSFNEVNNSVLYYVLVGSLFIIFGLLLKDLFFIIFGLVFLFLYYKGNEKYIIIETYYSNSIVVNRDNKLKDIIEEMKLRKKMKRRKMEFHVNTENLKECEKEKFNLLLKDGVITQDEYDDSIEKVELIKSKYEKEEKLTYQMIITKLLEQKGLKEDFEIKDYTFENKYLPGGFESFSGKIIFENGKKYSFWFDWDKKAINPDNNEVGFYTLGDSEEIIDTYGKSFFIKL